MRHASIIAASLLASVAQAAIAADFDGSKPLICAPVEANECLAGAACVHGTPSQVGVPSFLRVNVKAKIVQGPKRTSPVQVVEESDTQILMLGTELGFGWTMAIDRDTGEFSIAMTSRDGSVALFGACTPL